MPDIPQFVLDRARQNEPIFTADEVVLWPKGLLERLLADGVLKPTKNANTLTCNACGDDHVETVVYIESPQGTPMRAYIPCPSEGRARVDLDRLRQWAVDRNRLAQISISAAGDGQERASEDRFVFKQDCDFWQVRFRDERGSFKGSDGMSYIARLLVEPTNEFTPEQLRHSVKGMPTNSSGQVTSDVCATGDTFQEAMDGQTVKQCQERLKAIELERQAAREAGDLTKIDDLEEEEHGIVDYLSKARNVRGGSRQLGDKGRSRFNSVKQAIERAIRNLENANPPLVELVTHLRESINSENRAFVYQPPSSPLPWIT